jgi:hypothetical protein
MLSMLKDIGLFILGVAALYLLYFGTLTVQETDNKDESRQARIWMTYVSLAVVTAGGIVWLFLRF